MAVKKKKTARTTKRRVGQAPATEVRRSTAGSGHVSGAYVRLTQSLSSMKQMMHVLLILVIISLALSIYSAVSVYSVQKFLEPSRIDIDQFVKRLSGHDELSAYEGVTPLNIIQVTQDNLPALQSQIQGLNVNFLGRFLVQYPDAIIVYDYHDNEVISVVSFDGGQDMPDDFFQKLYAHPEVQGLEGLQPVGGILDPQTLSALQNQFPGAYEDVEAGHYLLRYPQVIVIFDYENDAIVAIIPLQESEA